MKKLETLFIADWDHIKDKEELISYYAMGLTNLLALLVYVMMLLFFSAVQIVPLVVFSVVNAVLEVVFLLFNRKGYLQVASIAPCITAILYAFVASCLVGWNSGFQWYILVAIIPQYLFARMHMGWKVFLTTMGLSAMLLCFLVSLFYLPPYDHSDTRILQFFNLILVVGCLFAEIKMNDIAYATTLQHHNQHIEKLEQRAWIDPLTGLWNRRYAEQLFSTLTEQCPQFCIAIMDLDHFKDTNDQYGHSAGDEVLVSFSQLIKAGFRRSDTTIRWGGEEFLVVLKNSRLEDARAIMEGFRKRVESERCFYNGKRIPITVTIGIAEYDGTSGIDEVIVRSDTCLYHGKNNGRNQVVIFSPEEEEE